MAETEGSDDTSESDLLDKSLSVWKGSPTKERLESIPLDFYTASSLGQYDCVKAHIIRGEVDVNNRNKGGWTALMYACYIGHDNIVSLLLEAELCANIRNFKGETPLMLAASCGNERVGFLLCNHEAELEAKDERGWTSLFHATYSGHQNMVRFLLEQGANMNAVEPSMGMTPFMEAAAEGHEIILQLFLQYGVNINCKAFNGDTARSLALFNGNMKIVSLIDNHVMPITSLRAAPGLDTDLSSSDDAFSRNKRARGARGKPAGGEPSIRDGPEAIARLIDRTKDTVKDTTAQKKAPATIVPKGYVTFPDEDTTVEAKKLSYRDVTSPINPEDYKLDSSGGRESFENEDETNAFTKTGALTIKSSSGSSGGLAAAFGIIRREDSLDSDEFPHDSSCGDSHRHGNSGSSSSEDEPTVAASNIEETLKLKRDISDSKQAEDADPSGDIGVVPNKKCIDGLDKKKLKSRKSKEKLTTENVNEIEVMKNSVSEWIDSVHDTHPVPENNLESPSTDGSSRDDPSTEVTSGHESVAKPQVLQQSALKPEYQLKQKHRKQPDHITVNPEHLSNHPDHLSNHPDHLSSHSDHLSNHPDHHINSNPEHHSNHTEHLGNITEHLRSHPENHPKQINNHPKPISSHPEHINNHPKQANNQSEKNRTYPEHLSDHSEPLNSHPEHLGKPPDQYSYPSSNYDYNRHKHLTMADNVQQSSQLFDQVMNNVKTFGRKSSKDYLNQNPIVTDSTIAMPDHTLAPRYDSSVAPVSALNLLNTGPESYSGPISHATQSNSNHNNHSTPGYHGRPAMQMHPPPGFPVQFSAYQMFPQGTPSANFQPNPSSGIYPSGGPHTAGPHPTGPHSAGPHTTGPHTPGPHTVGSHAAGPHSTMPHAGVPLAQPSSITSPVGLSQGTVHSQIVDDKQKEPKVSTNAAFMDKMRDSQPSDLATFLDQLGLSKHLATFDEQDVDLQVFLSLTDNDLKEVGIKLFGPRKKMTNAIARWHSKARIAIGELEQAYADRLEGEMQEMGVQLQLACEQLEKLKAQVKQEQQLRNVTETCLMEERAAWQHVQRLIMDTRQQCEDFKDAVRKMKQYLNELKARVPPDINSMEAQQKRPIRGAGAMRDNTPVNMKGKGILPSDQMPTESVLRKADYYMQEIQHLLGNVTANTDRLLGRNTQSESPEGGYS